MDCGSTILIFLAFIHATCGQSVTVTGPPDGAIEQGRDTVYTCTGGTAPYTFTWADLSVNPNVNIFINGELGYIPADFPKYDNFNVSTSGGTTSTMTIYNTLIEDEGVYRCSELAIFDDAVLTVEVKSTRNMSVASTVNSNNIDMYVATCEALDGRPDETITWMLGDGTSPCADPVETLLPAGSDLFSKRSVCTFQATSENYNQVLKCVISGHELDDHNGDETTNLDMHSFPGADIITVGIQILENSNVRVSCDIDDTNQTDPRIRNYYIYSDDTLIHQSSTGENFVDVPDTEYDPMNSEFNCVAGNYLGNTTTFAPISTTTLTPTTTADEPPVKVAAIAGGVVAAIVIIVIIVIAVCYCKKQERFCFEAGGFSIQALFSSCKCSLPTPAPSNKPSGRAVGSSNGSGSEKEKLPQAAPRGHGSIQHTNDNPDQAMYAMVDKKPARGGGGAGDAPDRGSAPGQNEPPGMLYADLDLSHKAGHTDKHVPKNENDVVVYSSILV